MSYLTGYTIKPYEVLSNGEVIFTDGTNNEIRANQQQCEVYGYTYDKASGTCSAFRHNVALNRNMSNVNNKFNGVGNTVELGGNTIQVNGTNNTTQGFNNNCFVNGVDNIVGNSVNNATVVGMSGTALREGEFVVGAGVCEGSETIQTSTFFLNKATTDGSTVAMFLNVAKDRTPNVTVIPRDSSAIITYTIDITAYRTGGASGSGATGDRAFFKLQGILKTNTATESLTTVASSGTIAGWNVSSSFSGSDWSISVRGAASMNITWTAKANFYEMKL